MSEVKKILKRGVSVYSYYGEYGITKNLENILAEMYDIGAKGVEILGNSHIEGYPNITDEWFENWNRMIREYDIIPVEYGHWVDSRLFEGSELTVEESVALAEKYDVRMCPEINSPTILKSKMIDDYVEFIKETGTKHFGLNIDFSVFQTGDNSLVGFGTNDFVGPPCEHSKGVGFKLRLDLCIIEDYGYHK